MKDNDIIKALECCQYEGVTTCRDCPMFYTHEFDNEIDFDCGKYIYGRALDLNNRQNAEIERYKGVIKRLEKDVEEAQAELKEFKALYVNKVAEMGIKAFAERLKAEVSHIPAWGSVAEKKIDNLVKEMTEKSVNYGSSKTEG